MDVGLELRQAREQRGVSLQQLSKITKISPRVLEAIEESDEAALPAPVFTRSFVKTYAAEVGLDRDETLRRYLEQFEPPEGPARVDATAEPDPAAPPRDAPGWSPARVIHGRFGTATVLILVGAAALALARRNYREAQSEAARTPSPAVSAAGFVPSATPQPQLVGTSGTTQAPGNRLQLVIAPTGPCWVQATVDGARVLAGELTSGDRRTLEAPSEITLRIGDPATFAFSINGKPARIAGAPGQAVTVRVTRENYLQFIQG